MIAKEIMTNPMIELVVHCYSEQIPQFASMLTAQLSSLLLWPPKQCTVRVVVCCTRSDKLTLSVCAWFIRHFLDANVLAKIAPLLMDKGQLFRRGCGRNLAAKKSQAGILWFIDSDYILGEGCLDTLAERHHGQFPANIVFPRTVHIHRSHRLGDEEIARIEPGKIFTPDLSLFEPRQEKMAIGGLQIVSGDTARKYGYCDNSKWSEPVDEAGGFRNTAEDKVYRNLLGGSAAIDLPNVFRLRHSASAFEPAEKRLKQTEGKA